MSTEAVAAASKLLDSIIAGDMDTALSALRADLVVHEAASLWYPGDWKGPEGFLQVIGLMTSKVDLKVHGYEVFDAGARAVMNAQVTFTSKATGRTLDMSIVEIYQARDGQLIDMDIYYKDTAAVCALADETA
jgi:ketosteroid isomerase-like protein